MKNVLFYLNEMGTNTEWRISDLQVPGWTVADVSDWIRKIGFDKYGVGKLVREYELDGDLLLRLDESNLRDDLKIRDGILRKRFFRELDSLKREADYSKVDTYGAIDMIRNAGRPDLLVYAYDLADIEPGVLAPGMLNEEELDNHLREECGIKSRVHRQAIVKIYQDSQQQLYLYDRPVSSPHTPTYSRYPSDGGYSSSYSEDPPTASPPLYISSSGNDNHLTSLLKKQMEIRGFTMKESVKKDSMIVAAAAAVADSCSHNDSCDEIDGDLPLLESYTEAMKECSHYILVLGPKGLEEFTLRENVRESEMMEGRTFSPLFYEIQAALKTGVTIIPFRLESYTFPHSSNLWPEIRDLLRWNAVKYVHDYSEASFNKLERFIRGDVFIREPRHPGTASPGTDGSGSPSIQIRVSSSPDLLDVPNYPTASRTRSRSSSENNQHRRNLASASLDHLEKSKEA